MDERLGVVVEINEVAWARFRGDIADVVPAELNWRPLPQANTINLILRHLRIDAAWHLACVEREEPVAATVPHVHPESLPLDFDHNLKEMGELGARFVGALRRMTLPELERRTASAY